VSAEAILALMAAAFLLAAAWRMRRDHGRIEPASRTWLLVGGIFALVSTWLWLK
jgi:hypothetical protein